MKRSGYTEEVMPERALLGLPAAPVPIAEANGVQRGVTPPARRVYKPDTYEMVSVEEAQARLAARVTGKLPPIKGGLDTEPDMDKRMNRPPQKTGKKAASVESPRKVMKVMNQYPVKAEQDSDDFVDIGEVDDGFVAPNSASEPDRSTMPVRSRDVTAEYRSATRQSVSLDCGGFEFNMPVIEAIETEYSVALVLDNSADGIRFNPKPASEVTLNLDSRTFVCYYPGVDFEIKKLGIKCMVFIKADR